MNLIGVAGVYAGVAFAAGFVMGAVRVLVLEPRLGAVAAVVIEGPIMLGVSYFAARWVVARWMRDTSRGRRVVMGMVALGMLLLMEFALAGVLAQFAESDVAGGWIAGFFVKFATAAGVIGAGFQVGFGVMPGVVPGVVPSAVTAVSETAKPSQSRG